MFDYTKAAVKKTVEDFKKLDYVRNVATQILYIVYLIYAVCVSAGKLWADIPLLALAVAYFLYYYRSFESGVLHDLAERLLDGTLDDVDTCSLVSVFAFGTLTAIIPNSNTIMKNNRFIISMF